MEKLVIAPEEVARVRPPLAGGPLETALPDPVPLPARVLLVSAGLVLPVLCLATIAIGVAVRKREPRVRHAWLQWCCAALVGSGLFTSLAGGVLWLNSRPSRSIPAAAFVLEQTARIPTLVTSKILSPKELAGAVKNAIFIVARDHPGLPVSRERLAAFGFGTAALLFADEEEMLLATSRHVLDGERWRGARPYAGEALLCSEQGEFGRAQIAGRHKELDLMLLRLTRRGGEGRFAQTVVDFEQVEPGESVVVFGHPQGLFFSLSSGLVARKGEAGQIQITAPVSPGTSGGPVYDLRGQLLGIVTSMLDKRQTPDAENLNFAVRADSFLREAEWDLEAAGQKALAKFIAAARRAPEAAAAPEPSEKQP